ncbi:hypothetical protein Tcan_10268 [Toxocara canis]|uniref:Uncharacterized protein n=1 Tax=Toxocara canis TaxID=6265 RepID=A0A0B2UHU9_TOXCA|nr:hypothetical protein Tcan_10268 [Toxocara canis]
MKHTSVTLQHVNCAKFTIASELAEFDMPKTHSFTHEHQRLSNSMEELWDANADKYKCCCRLIHVTRASLYIAYIQMLVTSVFTIFFTYYYVQAVKGNLPAEHWISQLGERYITSLLFAVSLQLILGAMVIHGVYTERRAFLLPFIVFAFIAIIFGFTQIASDFFHFIYVSSSHPAYDNNQFFSHVIGTMVHLWCVSIVWRCYGFLGDKKVARQIGEQLSATRVAFHYADIPYGYVAMPQPPPYAETVISADKQPITVS